MDIKNFIEAGANVQFVVSVDALKEIIIDLIGANQSIYKETEDEDAHNYGYLTIDETAELLGVSRTTLWRWNKEGKLKLTKYIGRAVYEKRDVYNVLQNGFN